ncbi:hypothetical protein ES288_A10G030100v1 [Gossypium darwinii]|uniref:RING-type E3 ubiquitin transferase n=1 Tax=Gossypium darwinii TaxID=34276 RepID=A0A5D2EUE1_GOSDA|nr:hypothetical protein ES288_A10G030100v1 [Gossypium darwinii]
MKPPKLLRLVYPKNHSKTHFLHLSPFLFFTFFILLQASLIHAEIPLEYIKHCNGVVPVSPAEPTTLFPSPTTVSNNLDFKIGYFSGGDSIFFQSNTAVDVPKAATFSAQFSHDIFGSNKTRIYKVQGKLVLQIPKSFSLPSPNGGILNPRRGLRRQFRIRGPKIPVIGRGAPSFSLGGFWSESTGRLCMIGSGISNGNAEKYRVKGRIESTRIKSDPLYFGPINFSSRSFYAGQAKESIWRMDLEITMVLISNTLACLFVGMQLFHVKRHPEVLPFISVFMLVVLTLGHMIPLLLNFEALFVKNSNQQNAFLESGGWLEVNEIIVRAVTMVAFLLQFRLLQLTWSIRQGDDSQKGFWDAEKKALCVSLPLYLTGGLIAWFVHRWKNSHQTPFLQPHHKRLRMVPYQNRFYHQTSFWTNFKSYGGLILDGFLLPQILFNIFSKSNETALAASFYIGTTLVRLLPHAYDIYRAHSSSGYLDLSYIYANHKMDFYSTAWDIIIPCGGLLFAIFVFLQQRYGGQYLLPKRFRKDAVYEKVSVDNSEELQGETVQKNFYSL